MVQQLSLKLMRWIKLPTISPGVQNRRVQVDIQVTDKTNRSMSQPSESVALKHVPMPKRVKLEPEDRIAELQNSSSYSRIA